MREVLTKQELRTIGQKRRRTPSAMQDDVLPMRAGLVSPPRQRPTAERPADVNPILQQQLWLAKLLQEAALQDECDTCSEASSVAPSPGPSQLDKVKELMSHVEVLAAVRPV